MVRLRRVHRYWSSSESPSRARKAVRYAVLAWECGDAVAETAELLTSELATNAVLHASCSVEYVVELTVAGGVLTVSVIDFGSGSPSVTRADDADTHGRGLSMVEMLSDAWGVDALAGGGKRVFFRLGVPALPRRVYEREASCRRGGAESEIRRCSNAARSISAKGHRPARTVVLRRAR